MRIFFLALFDTEKEESVSYYCPVLAEDADGGKEALYRIKRREGYEIRICEELAESLLERGAVGMELGGQHHKDIEDDRTAQSNSTGNGNVKGTAAILYLQAESSDPEDYISRKYVSGPLMFIEKGKMRSAAYCVIF